MKLLITNYQKTLFFSWVSRGIQSVVSLLMIPLITRILSIQDYSVFILIISINIWVLLSDFGLGISLQNKISELKAIGKDYEVYIVNLFLSGIILLIPTTIILYYVSKIFVPIYLNKYTTSEINFFNEFFLSTLILAFTSIANFIYKVWYAIGKGYFSNILPAIGISLSYFFLYILHHNKFPLSLLHVILIVLLPLFLLPAFFFVTVIYKLRSKICYSFRYFFEIFPIAKKFFLFALLSALVLNIDYFIASQYLNSSDLILYNTIMKIYGVAFLIYTSFISAIWPIISEKIHRGDASGVYKILKTSIPYGILFLFLFSIILLFFWDSILNKLINNFNIHIDYKIIILCFFYFILRVWTDTFAMVLQSVNKMNSLILIVIIQAFISITFQVFLSKQFGVYGILLALITSFLFTVSWYLPIKCFNLIKENKYEFK